MRRAAIDYPDYLPCASRDDYSFNIDAGVIMDNPETTPRPIMRRLYTNMPTVFSITFNVRAEFLFLWQLWMNANGYSWFNLSLAHPFMAPGVFVEVVPVRLVSGSISMGFDQYNNTIIKAEVELSPIVYAESDVVT